MEYEPQGESTRSEASAEENTVAAEPRPLGSRKRSPEALETLGEQTAYELHSAFVLELQAIQLRRQRVEALLAGKPVADESADRNQEQGRGRGRRSSAEVVRQVGGEALRIAAQRAVQGLKNFAGEQSSPSQEPAGPAKRTKAKVADETDASLRDALESSEASSRLPRTGLTGLALSGGGIRSATFSLGVLQAMAERNLLWMFDFLSTVSGGGFTGGWWSAWLSRKPRNRLFPDDERLEPDRYPDVLLQSRKPGEAQQTQHAPDGSRSVVAEDPIHHLRLFSNYLTPRKGLLSADTWRAITIVSRNLILNWLILLPLLIAATLVAQLYFAGNRELAYGFACSTPDSAVARKWNPSWPAACIGARRASIVAGAKLGYDTLNTSGPLDSLRKARHLDSLLFDTAAVSIAAGTLRHGEVVKRRLAVVTDAVIAVFLIGAAFTTMWLLYSSSSVGATFIGFLAVASAVFVVFTTGDGRSGSSLATAWRHFAPTRWWYIGVYGAIAVAVWWAAVPAIGGFVKSIFNEALGLPSDWKIPRDKIRNELVRWHARVLMLAVVAISLLMVAGFGHEVVWWMLDPEVGVASSAARKAGGWGALLIAAGSGAFAFLRGFPSTKGKDEERGEPGKLASFVLAIAPPSVLLVLAVGGAYFAQNLVVESASWGYLESAEATPGIYALLVGATLAVLLALYEAGDPTPTDGNKPRAGYWATLVFPALAVWALNELIRRNWIPLDDKRIAYALISFTILVIGAGVIAVRTRGALTWKKSLVIGLGLLGMGVAIYLWLVPFETHVSTSPAGRFVYQVGISGLVFVVTFLFVEIVRAGAASKRTLSLMTIVALESGTVVLLHYLPHGHIATALATNAIGWAGFFLAWVVGLGWMADPNLLSLHAFYRSRLVRAYLGASNATNRRNAEITEAVANDDLPLKDLKNEESGAPLHIVGATLNLVGGRDLATSQRSASSFTMSSKVCGSGRTGYRRTDEYMDGTLSLGTAIATSGAAVSPNMGSKSSSALALLLAFFNVRLGVWVPTPNKTRWRDRQPRLWPFYLLREALSQTNAISTYCYLTDGGHFDNTGLYPLVERGCQHIIVLDDGADPKPSFSDMGDAIRRCRIDFGAEIAFADGIDVFTPSKGLAKEHLVRGKIRYSEAHLKMLGWTATDIRNRRDGVIIWVKPAVTKNDRIDVRQYKLANNDFPQQTTADQSYDEAQFESYRALGYQAIATRLDEMAALLPGALPDIPKFFRDI